MAFSPAHVSTRRWTDRSTVARPLADRLARSAWLDALVIGTIVALAGLIRWPNLQLVPQFTSGGDAILMALDIASGRAFYLREVSPYIGAPYIWLLALVYRRSDRASRRRCWSPGHRRADDGADLPAGQGGRRPAGRHHGRAAVGNVARAHGDYQSRAALALGHAARDDDGTLARRTGRAPRRSRPEACGTAPGSGRIGIWTRPPDASDSRAAAGGARWAPS